MLNTTQAYVKHQSTVLLAWTVRGNDLLNNDGNIIEQTLFSERRGGNDWNYLLFLLG